MLVQYWETSVQHRMASPNGIHSVMSTLGSEEKGQSSGNNTIDADKWVPQSKQLIINHEIENKNAILDISGAGNGKDISYNSNYNGIKNGQGEGIHIGNDSDGNKINIAGKLKAKNEVKLGIKNNGKKLDNSTMKTNDNKGTYFKLDAPLEVEFNDTLQQFVIKDFKPLTPVITVRPSQISSDKRFDNAISTTVANHATFTPSCNN